MLLSIIVLTCNGKGLTLKLLDSLSPWLRDNPDTELIVVDNASTDHTLSAIRQRSDLPQERIELIKNVENLGVAKARNIGLKIAKGEFIMLLDNDTEVSSEAIRSMVDYIRTHPDCGVCGPALYSPDGELQDSAKPFPGLTIKLRHLLRPKTQSAKERYAMASLHPYYIIGACQLFPRILLSRIGMLDEKIFYGPEDADWCARITQAGYTVDYLKDIKVTHHWQRATKRQPFSRQSLRHLLALLYFFFKYKRFR